MRALFGPARPALKLATCLALALVVAMAVVDGEYRVSARAVVEGEVQRAAVAPFDAVVVSGDLRQMLGSPIERGKLLFELAPLDAWRLVIQADEREVQFLAAGQRGLVALASMPTARLAVVVERVTPVAVAEDGRNFFRVEARVDPAHARSLRPGMEGIAKIETGPRKLLWIWTHSAVDWLRLFAWHWLP